MKEKEDILRILKKTKQALRDNDNVLLKNLSNNLIHSSSITQDSDIISITVILYSLSKLIERENSYKQYKNWKKFYNEYVSGINKMIEYLTINDLNRFREQIIFLRKLIERLSGKLKEYIQDVFRKARINKASRLYEHGLSMQKTAKILGISLWELSEYASRMSNYEYNITITMPIKKRVKIAEEVFK